VTRAADSNATLAANGGLAAGGTALRQSNLADGPSREDEQRVGCLESTATLLRARLGNNALLYVAATTHT
jgi:hypothetical protein